jgi:hypothetical protein
MERHTEFDPETNARLNELYEAWDCADRRAEAYDYGEMGILYFVDGKRHVMTADHLVEEADRLARQYDTLLANAKTTRQPHQINAGVYNSTYTFRTAQTAQIFAQAVNGEIDGRVVKTTASLVDINRAIARNMIKDAEILGQTRWPIRGAQ